MPAGNVTRVDADGRFLAGVIFRRCLQVYDAQRRFAPVYEDRLRQTIPCDTVLLAVGQAPALDFLAQGGHDIELHRPGWPKVDPHTLATSAPGVFVAGDLAHGTRLLIDAVASGKAAARSVYRYLTGRRLAPEAVAAHLALERHAREPGYEALRRVPVRAAAERLRQPDLVVELGYTAAQAQREASRCLDCAVTPVFDGSRCVLCGGCVDVCPTQCLKLVRVSELLPDASLSSAVASAFGPDADPDEHSAILKDEDRCIRCALCGMRCPVEAIRMERVVCQTQWRCV